MGVTLIYGGDSETFDGLVGQTVSAAVEAARTFLSVPADLEPSINGVPTSSTSTAILNDGDEVSFVKTAGSKGN